MPHDAAPKTLRLEFENLPLMEAALRVTVSPPVKLRFSLIEKMRKYLGDAFPEVSESDQIEVPPGITQKVAEFGPGRIFGAVFKGNPQGLTVTVQDQVVIARWSRQARADTPEYPRFPALRKALGDAVDALENASPGISLKVVAANLSYTNFLGAPDPSEVLKTYFSDSVQMLKSRFAVIVKTLVAFDSPVIIFRIIEIVSVLDTNIPEDK